jgi:hypothetical protein
MTTDNGQRTTDNQHLEQLIRTLLFEGYVLYPYRASSVKNRLRWTFGGLFPESWTRSTDGSDASSLQTECLIRADEQTSLSIELHFLQVVSRRLGELATPISATEWTALCDQGAEPEFHPVDTLTIGDVRHEPWQEGLARRVRFDSSLGECIAGEQSLPFSFAPKRTLEPLSEGGRVMGVVVRERKLLAGRLTVSAQRIRVADAPLVKLTVRAENMTELESPDTNDRDAGVLSSMASTLVVLSAPEGEFVSQIDPPGPFRAAAAGCSNTGVWPVMVGGEGERHTMLAAPIILYDYPQIAPQSPVDLCDATEIDELLALRIQTLTDDEKRASIALDGHTATLIGATETLPQEQMERLHGTLRSRNGGRPNSVDELRPGRRVRLRPTGRADAFDILLAERLATIESVEVDFEDVRHVAVTLDDDPGRDFGRAGLPGHRFFFRPDELELLDEAT